MKTPSYEIRLDALFNEAFGTNDAAMLDYVALKFELKYLRKLFGTQQADTPDNEYPDDSFVCSKCGKHHRSMTPAMTCCR